MDSTRNSYAQFIKTTVEMHKVVIFSKTYCPYSNMAKEVFQKLGVRFKVIELDKQIDGEKIFSELGAITGAKTVPRVFINGQFIGGGEEIRRLYENGSLKKLFNFSASLN